MPLSKVILRPGINVERTPLLNEGGWSSSQLVRFFQGMPQKNGGWQHLNPPNAGGMPIPLIGTARGAHAWADLNGNAYAAFGTEQRLQLLALGLIYDITPLRKTDNIAPAFSTTNGQKTVTVTDTSHGAAVGDWINILIPVSVGGIVLQGVYQVQTVVDANNYTIAAATAATATVSGGGAVPSFSTTNGSPNITITLNNHGLIVNSLFGVQVATTVGGITLTAGAQYSVVAPVTTNTFVIVPGASATSTATVSENSGNAQIQYLVATGLSSATYTSGYGVGPYGEGPYGVGTGSVLTPLRQWFLDNWGQDLIGNYTGSPIYVWTPPETDNNVALAINSTNYPTSVEPPTMVHGSFVAMPQQIFVAWGVDAFGSGTLDPNLIRWSDVADFTDWQATAANQAGSFRLPTGSRIVGGLQGQQFMYFWTDVDFWIGQYLGPPFVFGFQKIASGCELLSARAAAIYNSVAYWCSSEQFFMFDGQSVRVIQCPVWDKFFPLINRLQVDKVWAWVNSQFNEITWFFPSAAGTGECDSYVRYNAVEGSWDYGTLGRTCGFDTNVYGPPIAVDTTGLIQQHEVGNDADGAPMMPSIRSAWFSIADGSFFTFIERLIPDLIVNGGNSTVQLTVYTQNYPTDPIIQYGPFNWNPNTGPPYQIIRGRGRVASLQISSSALGVFWRLGAVRYLGQPAGRR